MGRTILWPPTLLLVASCLLPSSLFATDPGGSAVSTMPSSRPKRVVIVIHGGAGVITEGEMKAEGLTRRKFEQALARSLAAGYDALQRKGGTSVDAVEAAVRVMEDCALFNAGVGAAFNSDGRVELDAAIMEGKMTGRGEGKQDPRKKAGAVAAVTHIKNPISAARAVMEMEGSRHVLLVGDGAEHFALEEANRVKYHIEAVSNLYFWTDRRLRQIRGELPRNSGDASRNKVSVVPERRAVRPDFRLGTVGAVACDRQDPAIFFPHQEVLVTAALFSRSSQLEVDLALEQHHEIGAAE
jgi:L-asparaginase / beta-aspartyl-peptidase